MLFSNCRASVPVWTTFHTHAHAVRGVCGQGISLVLSRTKKVFPHDFRRQLHAGPTSKRNKERLKRTLVPLFRVFIFFTMLAGQQTEKP